MKSRQGAISILKYGEIIELGRHRLMCGDATRYEDVMKLVDGQNINLVLTDPPYGNSRNLQNRDGTLGGSKGTKFMVKFSPAKKYPHVIGNDTTDTARVNYDIAKDISERQIIWGGNYFTDFLPVSRGWLYWDKQNSTTDYADGELAWTSINTRLRAYSHKWNGCVREGSRILNGVTRVHPTQKPVELHARILEDFSRPDDVILDCFGGSGTTLIACEITGRKCLMMEISPEYCEIIRERYEKLKAEFPGLASGLQ